MEQIANIMTTLRTNTPDSFSGSKIVKINDYANSLSIDVESGNKSDILLPKSNVLSFFLEDGSSLIIRPSGTEPKIKLYFSAVGENKTKAAEKLSKMENCSAEFIGL